MVIFDGWLDKLTGWLKDAFSWLFHGIIDFFVAMALGTLHLLLDGFLYIVNLIPLPSFMTSNTLGGLLGGAGPVMAWVSGSLGLGTAMSYILAGYLFRLTRKLLTLGQW